MSGIFDFTMNLGEATLTSNHQHSEEFVMLSSEGVEASAPLSPSDRSLFDRRANFVKLPEDELSMTDFVLRTPGGIESSAVRPPPPPPQFPLTANTPAVCPVSLTSSSVFFLIVAASFPF